MVQKELKEEASYYEKVHVAYVYESPYLEVKDFHDMDHNTPIYYKEPCEGESHDLVHVLFMGLMLLKELQDKGLINEDVVTATNDNCTQEFANGKAGRIQLYAA